MTRGSVLEYAAAVRDRYRSGDKVGKGKILDEFVRVTGYHRKAAIRLLFNPRKQAGWSSGPASPLRYCTGATKSYLGSQ